MQRTKLSDRGQLRVFHFPMCIRLAKSLKPTRVVVPHTSQRSKAASSLRFAAALHRMARFWTAVASVARHRFNAGARVFREILADLSPFLLVRAVSEVFDLQAEELKYPQHNIFCPLNS